MRDDRAPHDQRLDADIMETANPLAALSPSLEKVLAAQREFNREMRSVRFQERVDRMIAKMTALVAQWQDRI